MPVLHDALDRSFLLAAAMDSRGYGRTGPVRARRRRRTTARCCSPGCSVCAPGAYGLLDATTPRLLGMPDARARRRARVLRGLVLGGRRVTPHAVPARPVALRRNGSPRSRRAAAAAL